MDKKKLLRRAAWTFAGLALAAAGGAVALRAASAQKLQRIVKLPEVAAVPFSDDAKSIELGRYLYRARGCVECHGANGAGHVFVDEGGVRLRGANITRGAGGVIANYTERDWVRAIRHGVKPDGRPVFIMPSEDYNRLTDGDLAAIVGYVRSLPPVDAPPAKFELPFIVHALYAAGVVQDAAEKIDHSLAPSLPVPVAVSAEHGYYVSRACIGCHGPGLAGGKIPGAPPDWPPAANLTPGEGSVLGRYAKEEDFRRMLRTGVRPDGSKADAAMPKLHLNELDMDALLVYLKTAPARAAGSR